MSRPPCSPCSSGTREACAASRRSRGMAIADCTETHPRGSVDPSGSNPCQRVADSRVLTRRRANDAQANPDRPDGEAYRARARRSPRCARSIRRVLPRRARRGDRGPAPWWFTCSRPSSTTTARSRRADGTPMARQEEPRPSPATGRARSLGVCRSLDGKIKGEGRMVPKCARLLSGGRPSASADAILPSRPRAV